MKGLRRVFTLLAISAVLTLLTGNLTVLADNPDGGTADNPSAGTTSPESETPGTASSETGEGAGTDVNTGGKPAVTQPYICDSNGMITGVNPEYLQALADAGQTKMSLKLPASVDGTAVKGIGPNAFAASQYVKYNVTFTDLDFSGTSIQTIGSGAFAGCTGLTGSLHLPSTLVSVGDNAFASTGYSYIYFPKSLNKSGVDAFAGMTKLIAAICPDEASYNTLSQLSSVSRDKLTYPLTLSFQDEAGAVIDKPRAALYHMPLTYILKDDKSCTVKKDYKLPVSSSGGEYTWKWSTDKDWSVPVTPSSLVEGNLLIAQKSMDQPVIRFGNSIDKTYDKSPAALTVTASHPLAKADKDAGNGDVVFLYTWKWKDNTGITNEVSEFDTNTMEFTNASDFICTVKVQAFVKGENEPFYEGSHEYKVKIRQASSVVKPVVSSGIIPAEGPLPDLSLGEGSTPGTIAWDENQPIREGKNEYSWTFTPKDNINYTTVTGKVSLQSTAASLYTVLAEVSGKGKVTPDGTVTAEKGKDLLFTFTPDPGYKLGTVIFDGVDITGKLKDNTYKIENVPAGDSREHKLSAAFKQMDSDDINQVFRSLPEIKEGDVSNEQRDAYLDAKIQYETLSASRTPSVSQDTLLAFYRSFAKLSEIDFDVDNKGPVSISDYTALLDSMTLDEAKGLKDGTISNFSIQINVSDNIYLNTQQRDLILAKKKDGIIADSYSIDLKKIITQSGTPSNFTLTESDFPLTMKFPLPKGIKSPASGYERTFYVAAIHNEGKARTDADILSNKDSSGKTITVTTERFSIFTVLYQDVKKAEDPHNSSNQNNSSSDKKHDDDNASSNTYVPDYEKDFWDNVTSLIKKAKAGDTVNVNAVTYDKMPESVMAALRENPKVALIVRWDGGKPVMIPAQTALAYEKGRVYYPLSLLSELYAKVNAALTTPPPATSGSGSSGSTNSGGGNSWEISAPSSNNTNYTPTSKDKGTETETEEESETETTETETPSETAEESSEAPETTPSKDLTTQEITKTSENKTIAVVLVASFVLLVLVVVIIVVLLSIKKKQE